MSPTAFRIATVASMLLSVVAASIDTLFPGLLSPGLAQAWQAEPAPSIFEHQLMIGPSLIFAAVAVASAIGLLLFQPWARAGCLLTTVIAVGLSPFLGSTVMSGSAMFFSESAAMLWGAVLSVAYFSPLSRQFEKTE